MCAVTVLVARSPGTHATGAAALLVATLYLPSALVVAHYPVPNPSTSCTAACPGNAFAVGAEPAFVNDIVRPLRDALAIVVFTATTLRLGWRIPHASRLT